MKKYSKPSIQIEKVAGINEPVFLGGSIWLKGDCYTASFRSHQRFTEPGPNGTTIYHYKVQIDAIHNGVDHTNANQHVIFGLWDETWADLVSNISMDGTYTGQWNDEGQVLFTTAYTQNEWDRIGSGGVDIVITFNQPVDPTEFVNGFKFDSVLVNDYGFRHYTSG